MDFPNFLNTKFVAWWGAIVATLTTLLWNIFVAWRSGPRIKIRAVPNMQIFPEDPATVDKTFISMTAVNRGNAPTTITHFSGFYSDNLWHFIRKQRKEFIINTNPTTGDSVPRVLAPGEEWKNIVNQASMQKMLKRGYLYIGVYHNQRNRPVYVRVRLKATQIGNDST